MLKCWHQEPMKRPTFETIHNDFVDFDATCNQYDYAFSDYMKANGMSNTPNYPTNNRKRQPRNDTPRTGRAQPRK